MKFTSDSELTELINVWEGVSEYTVAQSDEAMLFFMQEMMRLLQVKHADWLAGATGKDFRIVPSAEMVNGWHVVDSLSIDPTNTSVGKEERYYRYMELKRKHGVDPLTVNLIRGAGKTRALRLCDTFPDAREWQQQWLYQEIYLPYGRSDVMHTVYNVDSTCESYLLFYKGLGEAPFTEQDRQLALLATAGVAKLHQRMLYLRGASKNCQDLLSPQEKRVVKMLFNGAREKGIAKDLSVSISMARKHCLSIYRKLGLAGKLELLADAP